MKAETNLLPTEPTTHIIGSHWREWILCENYSIQKQELQTFYALKQQANVLFEAPNDRWDLIKSLYSQYFGTPVQVHGKEWMRLGFQGQYPQTDFRGGGVLSLQLILRYVKRNKEIVKRMESDKANFFFAITAINLAFYMKKYFHLADFLVAGKDKEVYCDRRAFKNFCRLLLANQEAYQDLHELFLTHFYNKIWLQAQKKNDNTLLQFNDLFEQLTNLIRSVFENHNIATMQQLLTCWHASIQ